MADLFEECLSIVLGHEGGDTITDNPDDPGGLTRWGIAQHSHPTVDVRNLTRELAAEIYKNQYWRVLHCDDMPRSIALMLFDSGVNQGPKQAAKMLQRAVGSNPDGIIGPRTLAAVWRLNRHEAIKRFTVERIQHYQGLGGFRTFGRGWLNRAIDVCLRAGEWSKV